MLFKIRRRSQLQYAVLLDRSFGFFFYARVSRVMISVALRIITSPRLDIYSGIKIVPADGHGVGPVCGYPAAGGDAAVEEKEDVIVKRKALEA